MPYVLSQRHLDLIRKKNEYRTTLIFHVKTVAFLNQCKPDISKLCWAVNSCVINCLSCSAPLVWCTNFDRNGVPNQSSTVILEVTFF